MGDQKDIGKLFRERLENFEKSPAQTTWKDIESELYADQPSNRNFWIPVLGATIVILAILIPVSYFSFKNMMDKSTPLTTEELENCNETNTTVNIDSIRIKKEFKSIDSHNKPIVDDNTSTSLETSTYSKSTPNDHLKQLATEKLIDEKKEKLARKKHYEKTKIKEKITGSDHTKLQQITSTVGSNKDKEQSTRVQSENGSTSTMNNENLIVSSPNLSRVKTDSIIKAKSSLLIKEQQSFINTEDSIKVAAQKDSIFSKKEISEQSSFWKSLRMGAHIFPTQLITSDNNYIVNSPDLSIPEKGKVSYGLGTYLEGEMTNNWSLRVGVNLLKLKSETNNINVSDTLLSRLTNNGLRLFFDENPNNGTIKLSSNTTYIEVPLDFQYKLSKRRVSPYISAGFSFLYLQKNSISIRSNSRKIGSADRNDILKANIGLRLGLGAQYKINEYLRLNIEPKISHFLFDSKNNNRNRPTYVSFQLGVSFKF